MDWIRENKPLAAILGVIIVGSLALGYLLFDAWGTYTEAKDAYLGLGNQVAGMKGARLAPTDENLKAKQAQVEEYAKVVNTLGTTVLLLQPKVEPIKDIEFQAKLKAKISDIRKTVQSKMQLPADFAFGFDEYNSSLPKSSTAATELSGYLDAMDKLVNLFLDCGVRSVDLLERSKLSVETQAAAAPQAVGNAGMQQQMAAGILEKRQISVMLTLDQGPLQRLVSALATTEMPYFTSLRVLRIENQRQDGPLRSEIRVPAPAAAATNKPEAGADEIRPPEPDVPDAVPVFGEELLRVRMEIDLVKFLDTAAGIAAQTPPAGAVPAGAVPAGR